MDGLFSFTEYLEYLRFYFASERAKAGAKSAFAKACGMQTSYLSQILAEKTQLSPEQALRGCQHLELNTLETEYFLLMVQKARSGTAELKEYYSKKMTRLQAEQNKLAARLEQTSKLSDAATQKYYSSWVYSVVHMIFSLPHVNTLKKAIELIHEEATIVEEALEFLMSEGMIAKTEQGYQTRPARIHLSSDSPLITQHHTNWRIKSLSSIQKNMKEDLHYSAAFTLSSEDAAKIREVYMEAVQKSLKIVAPSPEEVMYAATIDFFKIT